MTRGPSEKTDPPAPGHEAGEAYDELIRRAAPRVPNPGASRRQLRTLLHDRMRAKSRRSRWWRRLGLPLAAGFAVVAIIASQAGMLGSDGFELLPDGELEIAGETLTWMKSPVRGRVTAVGPDISADGVRDIQEAAAARDIAPTAIVGIGLDGGPIHWILSFPVDADGVSVDVSRAPRTMSVPNHPLDRGLRSIMLDHLDAFLEDVDRGAVPARPAAPVEADGVGFSVQRYDRTFPGLGTLNYFLGHPTP